MEEGWTYQGTPVGKIDNVQSPMDCLQSCNNEGRCASWIWTEKNHKCNLKDQNAIKKPPSKIAGKKISGRKNCANDLQI